MSDYRVQIYAARDAGLLNPSRYRWTITDGEPDMWDGNLHDNGTPMIRDTVARGYVSTLWGARREVRRTLAALAADVPLVDLAEGMEW